MGACDKRASPSAATVSGLTAYFRSEKENKTVEIGGNYAVVQRNRIHFRADILPAVHLQICQRQASRYYLKQRFAPKKERQAQRILPSFRCVIGVSVKMKMHLKMYPKLKSGAKD